MPSGIKYRYLFYLDTVQIASNLKMTQLAIHACVLIVSK